MPKFIIERDMPGVGRMSACDLCAASQSSCAVLNALGPRIQWVQSYVAGDRLYCIYIAPDEKLIREHAARAGIPADTITAITSIIDPTTAEGGRT